MTEAHFAAFQTVSADNHPIHYDLEYCRERGHKGPLAHGFQILSFTAAGASTFAHQISDTLIAFVEQSSKFLEPVYAGDTLYPMLDELRDQVAPALAGAAPLNPQSGAVGEFFAPMDYGDLQKKAPPPQPGGGPR